MVDDPCDPLYVVGVAGRRKSKVEYQVWVDYALGWSENRDCRTSIRGHSTEAEAMQSAIEQTDEMRRRGAESPVRLVRVTRWESGTSLRAEPALYEASYYAPAQKLTDAEVYAARVHDWHDTFDRINRHSAAKNQPMSLSYRTWLGDWGPNPTSCPACGTVVDPQNMY